MPERITIYGCEPDESLLFRELAPHYGADLTITDAPVSETTSELARGSRCVSVGHKTPITNATLDALARAGVNYVSTRSIGFDHLNVSHAESVGLRVGNVAYSPDSVADYTVMLMLMAIRQAKPTIRRADEHDYRLPEFRGRELRDLTVGVVGTGRIGSAVVARLRGFGSRILTHDSRPAAGHVPLDVLFRQSDIVTLHTPLDASTHHLVDRARLQQLRPGAFLVNTGRGPLVDTDALISVLESGHLGGAALDVVEGEEGIFYADRRNRVIDHKPLLRLQEMPNVLLSPHTAYYTDHALRDTVENSLINCRKFGSGEHDG
ncbi:D-isomer specific 2-hydroxyacid dehydrogenase family protein [Cryptosporangium phraense]|uniref:Lactate dehydrogenase n=1 Tax=Cryptosporangium phraense TaxID=2593070 RepID=A0A545AVA7_9ACTN|nr:D-isomer specific 2-hydroxyacid dehydrogenase family protein [Cryptosporangium phraense]TQS45268.1 lactate dehydrogenase [Cryptosporangium phraense]